MGEAHGAVGGEGDEVDEGEQASDAGNREVDQLCEAGGEERRGAAVPAALGEPADEAGDEGVRDEIAAAATEDGGPAEADVARVREAIRGELPGVHRQAEDAEGNVEGRRRDAEAAAQQA